jgi:hypothetical protein
MANRLDLRPSVPTEPTHSPAEQFQNETLRPILKLQHEHLVMTFHFYLRKRKTRWQQLSKQQRQEHILQSVRKDRELRQLLIGLVLGQCTAEELEIYFSNEKDLKRRLGKLLEQRLEDQLLG